MKFEKTFFQKLNTIADWIIRIILINFLMIVTSIPIITIFPSLSAGYKLFHRYINQEEEPLFKGYFLFFKENLGKKIWFSVLLIVLLGLGFINAKYYDQSLQLTQNWFFLVGYYITLAFLIGMIVITLYTLSSMLVVPKAKVWLLFKLSFYLAGKFIFRTLLLVFTIAIPFVLFMFPFTQLIFVFGGLSIPILLNVLLTNKVVKYVESLVEEDVQSGDRES